MNCTRCNQPLREARSVAIEVGVVSDRTVAIIERVEVAALHTSCGEAVIRIEVKRLKRKYRRRENIQIASEIVM